MAVFPLPRAPSRRAAGVWRCVFLLSWFRLKVGACSLLSWLSPRRLTEPPRTCGAGRANPSARSAGTVPFQEEAFRGVACNVPAATVAAALSAAVTTTQLIRNEPTLRRNQLRRSTQLQRQPLLGREGSGGRGASLREAASPPSISPPSQNLTLPAPVTLTCRPCGGRERWRDQCQCQ